MTDRDGLLFTAPDGGVLRYSNWLRRAWWPSAIAAGLGRMVEDKATGKVRYVGIGFHDLRRANATGLVAAGVDVKTAQGLLGHSDSRLTLDHYAQAVTELGEAAAEAMGERFMNIAPRAGRAMDSRSGDGGGHPEKRRRGPVTRPSRPVSGGGDLNSRPLRPERASGRDTRSGRHE